MIKELSRGWMKLLVGLVNIVSLLMFTLILLACIMYTKWDTKDAAIQYGCEEIAERYAMDMVQYKHRSGNSAYRRYENSGIDYVVIENNKIEFEVCNKLYDNIPLDGVIVPMDSFDYFYVSPIEYEGCGYEISYRGVDTSSLYGILSSNGTYDLFYYDNNDVIGGIDLEDLQINKNVRYVCIAYNIKNDASEDGNMSLWKNIVNIVYSSKITMIVSMVIFFFVFLLTLAFLIGTLGRKYGEKKIRCNCIDKIPLEILLVVFVVAEGFSFRFLEDMLHCDDVSMSIVALGIIETLLVLIICLIVKRAKTGTFFKYTLIGLLIRPLLKILNDIKKDVNPLIKVTFQWFLVTLVEIGFVFGLCENIVACLIVFYIYKILEYIFVVIVTYQISIINESVRCVAEGKFDEKVDVDKLEGSFKELGSNINRINDGIANLVDERTKSERMKTELITNVSHDIKTPLTSIINYVDLLKKENINNKVANEYIEVLDRQSERLKKLIVDLVEVSKATTGNMEVELEVCDVGMLLTQALAEFADKLEETNLDVIVSQSEENIHAYVDGRHLWRVFDNIINNICKYAMKGTRVYVDVRVVEGRVYVEFKNISGKPLNISADELMERFVRGDASRNTEGSGLGLCIAKNLTELMDGYLQLTVDGDLFKVALDFKKI